MSSFMSRLVVVPLLRFVLVGGPVAALRSKDEDSSDEIALPIESAIHNEPTDGIHWFYTGACYWTNSFTEHQVTISCAWYEKLFRNGQSCMDGPCPAQYSWDNGRMATESEAARYGNRSTLVYGYGPMESYGYVWMPAEPMDVSCEEELQQLQSQRRVTQRMESPEQQIQIQIGFQGAYDKITKDCPASFCSSTEDVITLESLAGKKVLVSPNLGGGKHCFELNALFTAIKADPRDPLRTGGEYDVLKLTLEMEQGRDTLESGFGACIAQSIDSMDTLESGVGGLSLDNERSEENMDTLAESMDSLGMSAAGKAALKRKRG